jgi:hypothetical protein
MADLHVSADEVASLRSTAVRLVSDHMVQTLHPVDQPEELIRSILAALIVAVADQRERDARIADSYRDQAGSAYFVCDIIAAAIRAQSS